MTDQEEWFDEWQVMPAPELAQLWLDMVEQTRHGAHEFEGQIAAEVTDRCLESQDTLDFLYLLMSGAQTEWQVSRIGAGPMEDVLRHRPDLWASIQARLAGPQGGAWRGALRGVWVPRDVADALPDEITRLVTVLGP